MHVGSISNALQNGFRSVEMPHAVSMVEAQECSRNREKGHEPTSTCDREVNRAVALLEAGYELIHGVESTVCATFILDIIKRFVVVRQNVPTELNGMAIAFVVVTKEFDF